MTSHLTPAQLRKVLVLTPSQRDLPDWLRSLSDRLDIRVVTSVDTALAALRADEYDAALSLTGEMLPAACPAGGLGEIIDALGQAVCVVEPAGRIVAANPTFNALPPSVADNIAQTVARLAARLLEAGAAGQQQIRQEYSTGRDSHFDLTVTVVPADGQRPARFVALLSDISSARRLRQKIDAIDAAGRELAGFDLEAAAKMDVGQRLALLEEKVIRSCHDLLHFDHLVVRVLDKSSNRLDTVLATGISEQAKSLEILASAEGNGITGYVAATGRPYLCADVAADRRYLPGLEGARSTLTVPLLLHQQVIGVLNVESDAPGAFNEDDLQIAEIFARYIALALHILKLLVVERRTATGQIAADVDAELASPLNEIEGQVAALLSDYSADAGLVRRVRQLQRDVERVKSALRAVTEPGPVMGLTPEQPGRDPLLFGKRILVADDEDIIRETVADVLAKAGAITAMASDGNQAVELLRGQPFDLVLSDIKMPSKNGYEVFAAARLANSDMPVILITGFGYDPNHAIVRASKEGLTGVLFKPFKVEQLLDEVRHAITAGGRPRN